MEHMIKVNLQNGVTKEYKEGTLLKDIASGIQSEFNFPILIARVDNNIEELTYSLNKKCEIEFYDRSSIFGNNVYANALCFLLVVAIKKTLGSSVEIIIQHSIDKGVYCEIKNTKINKNILSSIEKKMLEIVDDNYNFIKLSVARKDAIQYFKKKKQNDKADVLKYISNTYINLYRLDEYYDYFFSEMPYSTNVLDEFKLTYISENGFVLSYPTVNYPKTTDNYTHHEKLFDAFLKYTELGKNIGISNVADLNKLVSEGKYTDVIQLAEAHYNSQLANVANKIYDKKNNIKLVLIAGPSSSGKTTTARKLAVYLKARGFKTHSLSIDDYFVNRIDNPKKPNGEYDFECLEAVDTELFNKHLIKLLNGDKVLIPTYNFVLGEREYKDNYLQLKDDDIIIIEGLHALNPELTMAIEEKNKFKIYISPLTQLNIDNHNRIHTSDTRRLRRIIRDNKYRGWSAADTLKSWGNISEGEEKYIFPYQNSVDVIINSALIYELGILKTYAEPLLFSVSEDDEVYPEALRMINFLRNFLPIPSDDVPKDSILREFIGESCFH